jgi:hypothetical protein
MKAIAILPEADDAHPTTFRAVTEDRKAAGRTPGEALDALTSQLGAEKANSAVIVQLFHPDNYFTAEQRERLSILMERWQAARDMGSALPPAEQAELEKLVEEELQGSAGRTAQMSREFEAAQSLRGRPAERGVELRPSLETATRRQGSSFRLYLAALSDAIVCILLLIVGFGVIIGTSTLLVFIAASIIIHLLAVFADADYLAKREVSYDSAEKSADGAKRSGQAGVQ